MRVTILGLCMVSLACFPALRGDDKKEPSRSLAQDATALAGTDPKQGWVSGKTLVNWDGLSKAEEMRLSVRFAPDQAAVKDGKATGKVTLGVDVSKDGQGEVILHPADGTFELAEGKGGRTLTIKLEKTTITAPYQIEGKKLVFPTGLATDNWGRVNATVKLKGPTTFELK